MSATGRTKSAAEGVAGKAKEVAGKASGDRSTEAEGKVDQAKADLKKAGEHVKDTLKR